MSSGQISSPYSLPWLWPVRRATIPSRNMAFQSQAQTIPSRSLHIPRVPTRRGSM